MDQEPKTKRIKTIDWKLCLFCETKLEAKPKKGQDTVVRHPTTKGLETIFKFSDVRQDELNDKISPFKEQIILGEIKIQFHKSCRASYTDRYGTISVESNVSECSEGRTKSKRKESQSFDIRKHCFICGKSDSKRHRITKIATGTGKQMRDKVLRAAEDRQDETVIARMLIHEDLFAFDAKYNRPCYSHYISDRNVKAAQNKMKTVHCSDHDLAFQVTVQYMEKNLLSKQKNVTNLALIRSKYIAELNNLNVGNAENYSSWKIKERLQRHFRNRIEFVERPGLSDLVCSSKMTVGDALKKVAVLEASLTEMVEDIELEELTSVKADNDLQVLHTAAGILRKLMSKVSVSDEFYISSQEISLKNCAKFVPHDLYDFIMWCSNSTAFEKLLRCEEIDNGDDCKKDNLKALSICHTLISLSQGVKTPITLGLGIAIHHSFASQKMIDQLHNLGMSVSYDEVRRFLTSVAHDQNADEIYVPRDFLPENTHEENINVLVDAAIDNFDQNEDTLDGKSTTHSLATVLYKRCNVETEKSKLPRVLNKSWTPLDNPNDVLHRYNKPAARPEPKLVDDKLVTEVSQLNESYRSAKQQDLIWKITRYRNEPNSDSVIPGWTGFNSITSEKELPVAAIRYLPFIRSPPSDFNTIYSALLNLVAIICEKLGQDHFCVTADMAIYSKAQEILWAKPIALHGKVTMLVGGMHLMVTHIASIRKLYGDGGLLSLLTITDVYADATACQMLEGKQFSRAVRGIKIVLDALFRLFYTSMKAWLEKVDKPEINCSDKHISDLKQALKEQNSDEARTVIADIDVTCLNDIQNNLEEFREVGRQKSATFAYWDTFMDGAEILLRLIRAEKEGDFELHLNAVCETLTWFRAADRHNYAKYVPVYITEMKALETEHPTTYAHLKAGGFVVRRSASHKFNSVSTDMALEQTINREGKGRGGVIGLTLRKGALDRWLTTRHIVAEYADALTLLTDSGLKSNRSHIELSKARLCKDEEDVQNIVQYLTENLNPFDLDNVPMELINIISGQVASQDVAVGLSTFLDVGKKKCDNFVVSKLVSSSKSQNFWTPESRSKIATFTSMKKTSNLQKSLKISIDSDTMFRRLLAVSSKRDVDLQTILQHELSPVTSSLFHDDGTMRKSLKSDLAKKLEAHCGEINDLTLTEGNTLYIIDGMALLQGLKDTMFRSFGDLGKLILRRLSGLFTGKLNVKLIIVVFDRYDKPKSIKQFERVRRGDQGECGASHIIAPDRKVPNYRIFMKNSANKAALADFVSTYIISQRDILLEDQKIILAGGFKDAKLVKVLTKDTECELQNLFSDQEEADTRIILHASSLSMAFVNLVVRCDDTDVLILLLYYCNAKMLSENVFMHCGHSGQYTNRERFIPVSDICNKLGNSVCASLPAVHCLTGCDSTSSMYRIGKRTVYSKLVSNVDKLPQLSALGLSDDIDEIIQAARAFVLVLYGNRKMQNGEFCKTLDELRYVLASTSDKQVSCLPPTEDSFKQHVIRVRLQARIWYHSHQANPVLWDPVDNGWRQGDDGSLEPIMFSGEAAPNEVRDLTHLYCTDKDCSQIGRKCRCLDAGLKCAEFCGCSDSGCNNMNAINTGSDSEED